MTGPSPEKTQVINSKLYEPPPEKTKTAVCVPSKDSDQPGYPPILHCPLVTEQSQEP